jgi:hypothetical protein
MIAAEIANIKHGGIAFPRKRGFPLLLLSANLSIVSVKEAVKLRREAPSEIIVNNEADGPISISVSTVYVP